MREDTATVPLEATVQPQFLLSRKPSGEKKNSCRPSSSHCREETLERDIPGWARRTQVSSLPRVYEWEVREQRSWAFHVIRNNGVPEVAGSDVPEGTLNTLGLKGKQTTQRMTAWLKRQQEPQQRGSFAMHLSISVTLHSPLFPCLPESIF